MTYTLRTLQESSDEAVSGTGGGRVRVEFFLIAGGALWVFALMCLLSFSNLDPSWSSSGDGSPVKNLGGPVGAWLADVAYFLLGYSFWWLMLVGAQRWLALLAHWLRSDENPVVVQAQDLWWRVRNGLGLVFLIVGSTGLEWSRLHRFDPGLSGQAGGVLGQLFGRLAVPWMGNTGFALLCVVLLVLGLAWSFRFAWAHVAEKLGLWVMRRIESHRTRREAQEDMVLGEKAALERAQEVREQKEDVQEHHPEPVWIEPVLVDVPKSERVAKERQKPLFHEMPDNRLPQVDLLDAVDGRARQETVSADTLEMTSRMIEKKLSDFGVKVRVVAAAPGPVITRYEIEPDLGVKGSQVVNLARDLARSLSLVSVRVVETIPGKNLMALELPNAKRQTIKLSEILGSQVYNDAKSMLTMGLGKDIIGNPVVADLAKMPHCLVAGTTGSGKSVGINAMILSLLYKAEARDVRLLLIDPKMLEMSVYEGIPHLLAPVVTDMKQAAHGLNWCVGEMERRYKLMSKLGVRNLAGYNHKIDEAKAREEFIYNPFSLTPEQPEPLERLPHIVVVIDELADLMMVVGKKIEELIARLAQKARAAGIHLILATQRPSVDVITGLIKANIPTRLSFQVSSKIDSRTILDQMGAEALLGMGDMLYMPSGTGLPIRVHGAFVSDEEVHRVVAYLKEQGGEPNYIDGVLEGGTVDGEEGLAGGGSGGGEKDPMYDQAVEIVLKDRKASISYVQRKLKIGYNRAANLLEQMEQAGLVSAMSGSGQRDILVPNREN